jgi:hypothetical protein
MKISQPFAVRQWPHKHAAERARYYGHDRSPSSLKGASQGMYKSMSKTELRRLAKTKRKGKPTKKKRH